jgi:hypothetical protein
MPSARSAYLAAPGERLLCSFTAAGGGVVGAFEADLQRQVLLAFLVPGAVYMADALGSQTETLVIRGLSVGVGVRRVVFRKLVTGLLRLTSRRHAVHQRGTRTPPPRTQPSAMG